MITVDLDGAGYGTDGAIWGGEALILTYSGLERAGQIECIHMPGGDFCAYNPYRMLVSALIKVISDAEIRDITQNHVEKTLPHGKSELEIVLKRVRDSSALKISSGRFLDSVSSLIGLTYERTYEGELATRLEAIASKGDADKISIKHEINDSNGYYGLITANTLYKLIENNNSYKNEDIAAFEQKYLTDGVVEITNRVSEDTGVKKQLIWRCYGQQIRHSYCYHHVEKIRTGSISPKKRASRWW